MKQFLFLFLLLILIASAHAGDPIMPLEQVKPGMRGMGKTILAGTESETFEFEVIEIIPNFKARRDVILVRLIGENVEHSGVAYGMSGSPMYIDDRLIGALAYMMSLFSKEPIAGITPIEEMFEIFSYEKSRPAEIAASRGFNEIYLNMAVRARDFSWPAFTPPYLAKTGPDPALSGLSPMKTPLVFYGLETAVLQKVSGLFAGHGFEIAQGGGSSTAGPEFEMDTAPLAPGDAYSVVIVDGDLGLQATGTVTYVDGDKVLGMGHPFFNQGAVSLPMGRAKILTTLASIMASTKMSALTGIIGTVHQDRTTGVMGMRGETPDMIPIAVSFHSEFQPPVNFNFRVAADKSLHSLTPLITNIVLANALESARISLGGQTLKVDGSIDLESSGSIPIRNYYAGNISSSAITDALEATGEVSAILGALLSNTFETPRIESVRLDYKTLPGKQLAAVSRIEVSKTVVKPGDEISVYVELREHQGELHRIKHEIKIPENLRERRVALFAGSGDLLAKYELRGNPQKFKPSNFEQLLAQLNSRRPNNYIFFQLSVRDKGFVVEGAELPDLPPTVVSILNSRRATGNTTPLRERAIFEDQVETDFSLSDGQKIWLTVDQH